MCVKFNLNNNNISTAAVLLNYLLCILTNGGITACFGVQGPFKIENNEHTD